MNKIKKCILIALACSIILSFLFYFGFLSNIQLKLSDNLYGGKTPLDGIVIVAIDDNSLQEIGRWPWERENFAKAIDYLDEAKVIGIDVAFFEPSTLEQDILLGEALSDKIILPVEFIKFAEKDGKVIGTELLEPIEELANAKTGYVNIVTDRDGVTRAVNMDISEEHENFAYAIYKEYWKKEIDEKPSRFLVNFAGKPGSFRYYSMTDVIHERIAKEEFKRKLVLIGATSPDLHDDYFVPTSGGKAMPGVEVHANTIQTLINQDFLKHQPRLSVMVMIFALALLTTFLVSRINIAGATAMAAVFVIAYLFVTIKVFSYGLILNIIYAPLSIVSTYLATILYFYVSEKKEKQKVYGAFKKYVSPVVISDIMKHPEKLKLGGERRDITVFFSDIRGFTSISEKLSPEKLVKILNEYLTAMTDIVMKHEGVVDKYIGDAIMAFWGAPLTQPDHAKMAARTALDMIKRLEELKIEWKKQNFPEINIGIGLNSGQAVIGNMGSYDRFDYTAMGDSINLGSRLEGLTKQYRVKIIISETTKDQLKGFITRELDLVAVKGKNKPIKIYELVGREGEFHDEKIITDYESGLQHYFNKRWDKAIAEFSKNKNDKPAEEFIKRCEAFKKNPPAKDWNKVWEHKTK
jgi:adenylate cyclase